MKLINDFWQWLGEPAYASHGHLVAWWVAGIFVGVIAIGASQ